MYMRLDEFMGGWLDVWVCIRACTVYRGGGRGGGGRKCGLGRTWVSWSLLLCVGG